MNETPVRTPKETKFKEPQTKLSKMFWTDGEAWLVGNFLRGNPTEIVEAEAKRPLWEEVKYQLILKTKKFLLFLSELKDLLRT